MTTVPDAITGGIDIHLDVHVAAALDAIGGVLGVESFPADGPGYRPSRFSRASAAVQGPHRWVTAHRQSPLAAREQGDHHGCYGFG